MLNNVRQTLSALALVAGCLSLAGCPEEGAKKEDAKAAPAKAADAKGEINVMDPSGTVKEVERRVDGATAKAAKRLKEATADGDAKKDEGGW